MKLSLAEGLMLIALDDEEGRLLVAAEHSLNQGLLAASILELALLKKIEFHDGNIIIKDNSGTGNLVLDEVMKNIKQSGQKVVATIQAILPKFSNIQDKVIQLLVQRGILSIESTKLLFIPISERMNNTNYDFEQEMRDILKAVVIKGRKPSPAIVVLISVISYCNILKEVFSDGEELIDAIKIAKDVLKMGIVDSQTQTVLESLRVHFNSIN